MKRGNKIILSPEVIAILDASRIEGNNLYLPGAQLDRSMYVKVNLALTALGGKWKGGNTKAHIFASDPSERIESAILTGEVIDLKKLYQFFPTPPALADRLVDLADVYPGQTVLEPSAGHGAIVDAIVRLNNGAKIDMVELDQANRAKLATHAEGILMDEPDFLKVDLSVSPNGEGWDRIIANPPFAKGQDIQHVTHMMTLVRPGGVVVSVVSGSVAFREGVKFQAFRDLIDTHGGTIESLPDDSFKESGTSVNACVLTVSRKLTAKAA